MFFFGRKKLKICKPEMFLEELEPRIVLDATVDYSFQADSLHDMGYYRKTGLDSATSDQGYSGVFHRHDSAILPNHVNKDLKVVLVSDSVSDLEGVKNAVSDDARMVVFDGLHDSLKTITDRLTELVDGEGKKIGSLAVLAHAEKGILFLGTDRIDLANVQGHRPELELLGKNFAEAGQIQLFGCSLAGDVYGQGLVEVISVATHADVFASTNPTGHGPEKDWILEYSTNPWTQIQTVIDTEQMATLPVDLALGDVVITKGTIAPVTQGTPIVNLNGGLSVSNKEVAQVTTVTVLANPSSSTGWSSISVTNDATFLASVGFPPGIVDTSVPNEIKIKGATAGQATAVLGTLQGDLDPTFHGNAQILIYAQDPDGDWAADTLFVTVNPLPPVDPVIAVPGDQPVSANVTSPITGISISDADIGTTGKLTVTLSVSHGTLTVQVPATTPGSTPVTYTNAIVTFTDTLTNVNTALAGLLYTPTAGYTGYHDERISITAVDQSTPTQGHDTKTVVINVNAITYDNPIVHPPVPPPVDPNVTTPITGISITDADIGTTGQLTVTLSVSHGTLTVQVPATTPGATPTTYTNANVTFTDTLANVNTALSGLKYTPTTGFHNDTDTLNITAVDQNLGSSGTVPVPIPVKDIAYDNPMVHPPVPPPVDPNVTTPITGISITDADIGTTGQLTVTLSVSHGTLTVQVPATTPGATPTVYTNANVTFTDTLANVNTALAGLKYTPTTGFHNDTDTLNITAVDQNLGSSGTVPVPIPVKDIAYDNPMVHPPVPPPVDPNVTTPITGISITDADIGTTGQLTVTLSVSHGTLTVQVPATTPGATPTTYTNANVTFTDTLANVNTALAGLKYTPTTGFHNDTDTLNITAVDQNLGSSGTVPVPIPVKDIAYDNPVVTVPPVDPTVNANVTSPITGISISDADIGTTGKLTVTLSVSYGTLTVQVPATTPGSTPVTYTNSLITFTDTLANVNTALAGLSYTPTAKYDGDVTLSITAVDQSVPNPLFDTKTVTITVNNADPTITAPATFPVVTGSPTTITGISVADPDIGSTNMAVTLSVSHGVLNVATSTNVTGNGTSTLIINDTLANVNARLSGLQYTPTSTYSGSDTLKITANDQSTPTPGIGTGEVLITVNAIVNAPPVVTVPTATQSVSENSSIAITGISVSDADIGTTGKLTVTLSVSHGTVTVQVPGTTPTTYTNSIVTFTDTLSNVNTALAGLLYTPTAKYDNGDTLSVTAVDQSVPNPLFDTKTVAITVTNFAPSITAPATLPVVAGFPTTITGITVSDPDIGSTNMAVTLSVSYGALKEATSTVWSSTLTINDTLANVNTRLSGLQYVTYTGPDTLTITANDQSNPTAGTDSETVNITVTALPLSPPVITVPGTQTVNWNVPTPISDIYVEESGYTGQFTVTLSVLHGTVTVQVPATTPGTTPTVYTNANVTFTDTLTNINTALAGIKYTPTTGYAGAETLTITGVDQNSTPLSDSETVHITVINYAPAPVPLPPITITAPVVLSVNEDTAVTIRNAITVDYSDPGRELKVTLHVDHGSVTLGWKGWLDSYTGDVTPDAVFTGMVADVNNALYGLRYTPVHNYYGPDTLTVTVDDQSIPAVPVIKTVRLNVNSINDPPLITAPGTLDADQNVTKLISGVSVTDPELLDSPLLKMNMTLGVLHGTVAVTGAGPSPNIVFTDTLAQSNSRLGTLTYTPVPTYQGPDWLTISANDQGNSGSGGPMSDTKTVLIKVGKW